MKKYIIAASNDDMDYDEYLNDTIENVLDESTKLLKYMNSVRSKYSNSQESTKQINNLIDGISKFVDCLEEYFNLK